MSHHIDTSVYANGDAYFADKPAWHRLGTVVDGARTSREVKEIALNWDVFKRPLWTEGPDMLGVDADGELQMGRDRFAVPGFYATVRSDSNQVLGIVGDRYRVVQNAEAFDFVDELAGTGEVRYESAGALKNGRIVWLLARLENADAEVVPGDVQRPYLLLTNSHDGSSPVRIQPTFVRVVCWNTLSMAVREGKRNSIAQFTIRHVGDIHSRIDEAREVIGLVRQGFGEYVATAKQLAAVDVDSDTMAAYLAAVFPAAFADDASTRAKNMVRQILGNFALDERQQLVGMRRSGWAAVNAVTQYLDHERTVKGASARDKAESRLEGAWFGSAAEVKAKAFQAAKELLLV